MYVCMHACMHVCKCSLRRLARSLSLSLYMYECMYIQIFTYGMVRGSLKRESESERERERERETERESESVRVCICRYMRATSIVSVFCTDSLISLHSNCIMHIPSQELSSTGLPAPNCQGVDGHWRTTPASLWSGGLCHEGFSWTSLPNERTILQLHDQIVSSTQDCKTTRSFTNRQSSSR